MGNTAGKLITPTCLCAPTTTTTTTTTSARHHHDIAVYLDSPTTTYYNGLGHSFCYVQTAPLFFRSISGASVSANTSTPLSTALFLDTSCSIQTASFESSPSFASVPLQPVVPGSTRMVNSGPLPGRGSGSGLLGSGPIERGFLSGPIERGYASGPIDHRTLQEEKANLRTKYKLSKWESIKGIKDSIVDAIWGKGYGTIKETEWKRKNNNNNESVGKSSSHVSGNLNFSGPVSSDENEDSSHSVEGRNLQWARGKAGEDRVQVMVSEDNGWVFVGIYDGFNGPDAPDFLLSNLYDAVDKELKGLLNDRMGSESESVSTSNQSTISKDSSIGNHLEEEVNNCLRRVSGLDSSCSRCADQECENGGAPSIDSTNLKKKQGRNQNRIRNWNVNGNGNILELDDRIREKINQMGYDWTKKIKHSEVLKALSEALRKTEEAYLDVADKSVNENPELLLMGSCVLVMVMMGKDVYLMNVGDSRAVLGQKANDHDHLDDIPHVSPLQLTRDHNTYIKEEVKRIRIEHPDDPSAVVNDRLKGSLKVTRAFGAGFLKQPKWNEALLEMFRIDYVGSSPYLTCRPSLCHHRVGPRDRFLILSSDGLYQYFTNEEAVSEVELFMATTPEGDPAQHLVEAVLFRAAKKAGMDFLELLEIPQGERRRYHDDVSIIIISLEGQFWGSSM